MKAKIPYKNIKEYTLYKCESNGSYHFIINKTDKDFEFYTYEGFRNSNQWYRKIKESVDMWNEEEYIFVDLDEIYDYNEREMVTSIFLRGIE